MRKTQLAFYKDPKNIHNNLHSAYISGQNLHGVGLNVLFTYIVSYWPALSRRKHNSLLKETYFAFFHETVK